MNKILKSILQISEAIAVKAVPGAAPIDALAHDIIAHKGVTDAGIVDAAEGAILAVENIKGTDIADEAKFRAAVAMLEAGFHMMKDSLKVTEVPVSGA